MKKRIKLMAEYFAPPLWILQDGMFIPIEPNKLGLSEGLVSQLNNWAEKYNSKLNLKDPKASSFLAGEELLSLMKRARVCGKKYQVNYLPSMMLSTLASRKEKFLEVDFEGNP